MKETANQSLTNGQPIINQELFLIFLINQAFGSTNQSRK
jgi:hypothetical protein